MTEIWLWVLVAGLWILSVYCAYLYGRFVENIKTISRSVESIKDSLSELTEQTKQ